MRALPTMTSGCPACCIAHMLIHLWQPLNSVPHSCSSAAAGHSTCDCTESCLLQSCHASTAPVACSQLHCLQSQGIHGHHKKPITPIIQGFRAKMHAAFYNWNLELCVPAVGTLSDLLQGRTPLYLAAKWEREDPNDWSVSLVKVETIVHTLVAAGADMSICNVQVRNCTVQLIGLLCKRAAHGYSCCSFLQGML